MEMNSYLDAADVVFNEMLEILEKQMEANEQRETFGQPPLPYAIDIRAQLVKAEEKACEVHGIAVKYGRDTHGTAVEWSDKAISRFRDNLLQMIHRPEGNSALKDYIQSQIYEIWPALVPPRDPASEEVAELCELQLQADTIIDGLRQTINDSIENLWAITTAEQKIIAGTSANKMCLIHARTRCHLAALSGIILALWDRSEPPQQVERRFMSTAPCRWADKQKQRDETLDERLKI